MGWSSLNKGKLATLTICLLFFKSFSFAQTDKNAILGTRLNEEKAAKVEIYTQGEKFLGKIVCLKQPFENGKPKTDYNNPDKTRYNDPFIGLLMMKDFVFDGKSTWEHGTIYDARSGKTHDCYLTFQANNTLKVRGYMGIFWIEKQTSGQRLTKSKIIAMKQVFVTGGSGFVGQNLIPVLIKQGYQVKALARSAQAIQKVEQLGAVAVKGDLHDAQALANGVKDCSTVFHLAACVDFFASEKELQKLHVEATDLLLSIAKNAPVHKFIYLGAASVIMNGKPIVNADETFISDNIIDGYSKTKLQAENLVLKANSKTFQTVSLRPPLIWGKGDPNTLPAIMDAVKKGRMQFINGGKHRFVTCHVTNVCQALLLADQTEQTGKAYFLTDGEQPIFKDFIKKYLATQGLTIPDKAVSLAMAKRVAWIMEFVWKTFRLSGHPPLYKGLINTLGLEFVTNDKRARQELGYKTVITIDEGLHLMGK